MKLNAIRVGARASLTLGISAVALAASIALPQAAYAQTISTLRGQVEGAAAGTTVTATDTNTGQVSTATTNANGGYVMLGLRPSTYEVAVEGFETQTVNVPVGQTVALNFAPPATDAEGQEIVVTGQVGQNEVRTATVGTNVSQVQIETLPQNDRNFLNFAALAPGVSVSPSAGNRRVQAGAVSADNTNVFIDGLSLKNPVNHGGVAGQNFSKGNPFPQSAVQEFKVETQNFKAEFEQAGSAIITAVTKTGGQDFHGGAFIEYQPKAFIGRPFFDRPGNANNPNGTTPKPDYNRYQYGADLGGPIIPGVLHFYAAFEGTSQKDPSRSVNLLASDGVPASLISQYNGSYAADFSQKLYFGKLTLFATDADTFNASAFLRRESNLADFGGNAVPEHGRNLLSEVDLYQLEWNHRTDTFLNELTVAYNKVTNGTPRTTDGYEIALARTNNILGGEVALLGGNNFEQYDFQETWTFKNNATFYAGNHVIKAGAKVTLNTYERTESSFADGSYYFFAPTYTGFDTSTPFGARISTVDVQPARAKNTQIGLFIQDDWELDDHWTINAGLRWDYETNAKNEDFITPANIATALRAYQGWKAAGINPEDYISDGNSRDPFSTAFQPRLGVSYDVNGDRDLVIFAGAGRYYDRPLFITAGIETIKAYYQSVASLNFCDGSGQPTCTSIRANNNGNLPAGIIPWNTSYRNPEALRAAATATGLRGDVWLLNNDTKLPYSDQFSLGFRKKFGDWQATVTYSHIRSHNIFQFVRGNRYSNGWFTRVLQRDGAGNVIGCTDGGGAWVQDGMPDVDYAACPARNGDLTGFNGKLNIGKNDGKAVYNALYIQLDKPYSKASGWGITSTLTIQRPRTNVGTELGADEFFAGTDQTQFGWQFVQGVETFRFVGTGIVDLPWGITGSTTITLGSGPTFGSVIFGLPGQPQEACCRANLGGVYQSPESFGYSNVDLRLQKTFKLFGDHELTVNGAVFNVFDTVNRAYSAWGAGSGTNPTFEENGTVGNARSFQVGAKYKF